MNITATKLKLATQAKEIASKQGFNLISMEDSDKISIYSLLCYYGKTTEVYSLWVDTFEQKIVDNSIRLVSE